MPNPWNESPTPPSGTAGGLRSLNWSVDYSLRAYSAMVKTYIFKVTLAEWSRCRRRGRWVQGSNPEKKILHSRLGPGVAASLKDRSTNCPRPVERPVHRHAQATARQRHVPRATPERDFQPTVQDSPGHSWAITSAGHVVHDSSEQAPALARTIRERRIPQGQSPTKRPGNRPRSLGPIVHTSSTPPSTLR